MQEGAFYCYVPRSPGIWLLSRSHSEKQVHKRIDSVLSRSGSLPDDIDSASGLTTASLLRRTASATYVYPGGGLTVKQGVYELTSDIPIYRVQPYIYESEGCVVVFYGYLSNLTELARGMAHKLDPTLLEDLMQASTVGPLTAAVILQLYLEQRDGKELLLLSEIQGQFSFVVYDSKKRCVFAARDPSGKEPLYHCLDEDGGVSFTNTPDTQSDQHDASDWEEVPPGHFIAGKSPKLQQFALTPAELHARELLQHFDSSLSLSDEEVVSPKAASSMPLSRRASMERGSRGGGASAVASPAVLGRRSSMERRSRGGGECSSRGGGEGAFSLFAMDD